MVRNSFSKARQSETPPRQNCQDFAEGCVGCCVNMRWTDERITRYLSTNTGLVQDYLCTEAGVTYWSMMRYYFRRGWGWDLLLTFIMVIPTFGVSAVLWQRFWGSCPFAGYLDERHQRGGCLIHPARIGGADRRQHAFPLLPFVKCNRMLRCPALDSDTIDLGMGLLQASRRCCQSLTLRPFFTKARIAGRDFLCSLRPLPQVDEGAVLMEYVVLMTAVVLALVAGEDALFDVQGAISGEMGAFGAAFRDFYQQLIVGLSMPIP